MESLTAKKRRITTAAAIMAAIMIAFAPIIKTDNARAEGSGQEYADNQAQLTAAITRIVPDGTGPIPSSMHKIRYYFSVRNIGSRRAEGIRVHFPKPFAGKYYKGILDMSNACHDQGSEIVCDWPKGTAVTLEPGQEKGYYVVFDTIPPIPCHLTYAARVWAESTNASMVYSNTLNESVSCPVVPTPDRLPPVITPTPSPTPTPTPWPTPTPTPVIYDDEEEIEEEEEETEEDKETEIEVRKTDNREITRPGHTLTYSIIVRNTGDEDIYDLSVEDQLPQYLGILSVNPQPTYAEEDYILWENYQLEAGGEREFMVTVRVDTEAPNGMLLENMATVRSWDYDLEEEVEDITIVEQAPAVAGGLDEELEPVPISARTGFGMLGVITSLLGTGSLTLAWRRLA